jgi:hypothetical protein
VTPVWLANRKLPEPATLMESPQLAKNPHL